MPAGKPIAKNPVLGIDFGQDHIRLVEMRRTGTEYAITHASSIDVPHGWSDPESPIPSSSIAQKLKQLVARSGARTRDAVLGIPANMVMTRLLDLPPLPDSELPAVIDSEVRHFQMLRDVGGGLDYHRTAQGQNAAETQALVMAADDPILHFLQDIAQQAGLNVVAKEPALLAMMRAALPRTGVLSGTLFIAVSDTACEIAIVEAGQIALYRRLDVAGRDLGRETLQRREATGADDTAIRNTEFVATGTASKVGGAMISAVVLSRLTTEIQRSLDYFQRQFPASHVERAILIAYDPYLYTLQDELAQTLGFEVEIAEAHASLPHELTNELGLPRVTRYAPAMGLAMGSLGYGLETLPWFNLFTTTARTTRYVGAGSSLAGGIAASVIMLGVGFAIYTSLKGSADRVEAQNRVIESDIEQIQAELVPLQQNRSNDIAALAALSREGVPFARIMDAVTRALDPEAGLVQINFENTGTIKIVGESLTEQEMINTVNKLRVSGAFESTTVDSFNNPDGRGIRYNVTSRYILSPFSPRTTTGGVQ